MTDPYVVLGVSRTASDEEIKKKYRELARKYHPDNYANNPLANLAQEKMKQINEAYDAITKERAGGGAQYKTYTQPAAHPPAARAALPGCSLGDHGGRSRPRGDDPRLDRGPECGMAFSYGCGGISPRLDGRGVQILPPGGVDGSRQCGIPSGGRSDGKSGERPVCGRTRRWNEHARLRCVLPMHGADGRLRRLRAVYLLLLITF